MSDSDRPWLRHRQGSGLDLEFIVYWALVGAFVGLGLLVLAIEVRTYAPRPQDLFGDATVYWHATRTWLSGGDPWTANHGALPPFAAPPPALLLNLPLQPFGPEAARGFWIVADVLGWLVVIRRLRLGPWWLLFPPFLEGLFPASPDLALAGAVLVGGGWLAAVAKPYSLPNIIADRRWAAVVLAGAVCLVTLPVLPWATFVSDAATIQQAFSDLSLGVSAWGNPPVFVLGVLALVALGPTMALRLSVPVLWPYAQFHYSVFSAAAAVRSAALGVALATPGYTAQLVIVFATVTTARRVWISRSTVSDTRQSDTASG